MAAKVAMIGTGLIGRGWAAAFARAGWRVALWDRDPAAAEAAQAAVRRSIEDFRQAGLLADIAVEDASVRVAQTLQEALDGATYAQESVPESVEAKRAVFSEIDRLAAPGVLVGSSTSTIPGSAFLSGFDGRSRLIVAHPANPPHLMPVVEIVPSPWHDAATVERVCALLAAIGQVPVVIRKEIEGFVMNRLQTAVVNEAVALVAAGVIDPADLDKVMKHSLGLRWALMGPFETMDLNAPGGFGDYAGRYGHLYQAMGRHLSVTADWPAEAIDRIEASRRAETPREAVNRRMRWRDRALMRLMALKRSMADERDTAAR